MQAPAPVAERQRLAQGWRGALHASLHAVFRRHWWQRRPTLLMQLLRPWSWLYAVLAAIAARRRPDSAPVPVVVVGNLVVGGAGKTPTVIALVQRLQQAGWRPGVIARGHGGDAGGVRRVTVDSAPEVVGDEPLLVLRRTGVPVWVGRSRLAVARALCGANPDVDVLVSDDGLQHHALARAADVIVIDERGVGNGLLLPAGPLRQRLPARLRASQTVLYNAPAPTTALAGALARRNLSATVLLLSDWHAGRHAAGVPLGSLRHRPLLAVAGIASPDRFFGMLQAAGLTLLRRLPLPDHHRYATLPWPADSADVVTTEKDAVKLGTLAALPAPAAGRATRVWVVGLDFVLPESLVQHVLRHIGAPPSTT